MSDFILDFRERSQRNKDMAAKLIQFFPDMRIWNYENEFFSVDLSRVDDWNIWGPYHSHNKAILVVLVGRIALDTNEWEDAKKIEGEGGLACKAIFRRYKEQEVDGLKNLNGNFVVLVFDLNKRKFYVVTDRCGVFPCFIGMPSSEKIVLSSHADALACVLNGTRELDMVSLAEFLITGKVSFPHSYYKKIKGLDCGAIYMIDLGENNAKCLLKSKYFTFNYSLDHGLSENELAEELGVAYRNAMRRRTLSILGQTAISLSGGLDSRAFLCSVEDKSSIKAFCFYDTENSEYNIAREIADVAGVSFIPLRREFDFYANNAEMGVRISGGMGSLCNNHYLGFRDTLRSYGLTNLLAGFYCDYLFKGIVLNKRRNKLLRTEFLSRFSYEHYQPIIGLDTDYSEQVLNRLDTVFPESVKKDGTDIGHLRIEQKRLFPLYYEPDNAETLIPQRTMPWYLPVVDNDVVDVYLKIPPKYKLNVSMYSKMVKRQCGKAFSKIPNSNTGAEVGANSLSLIVHEYKRIISDRTRKMFSRSIGTDGSWPDWGFYMRRSDNVRALWLENKGPIVDEMFEALIGRTSYRNICEDYTNASEKYFFRLLTLKLWLGQFH